MTRRTFQLCLSVAFIILTVHVSFGSTNTTEVGASMPKLLEADWIERDGQLNGQSQQDKSNDFSLERTRQIIARAYKLAERLQQLSASGARLEPLVKELKQIEIQISSLKSASEFHETTTRSPSEAMVGVCWVYPTFWGFGCSLNI